MLIARAETQTYSYIWCTVSLLQCICAGFAKVMMKVTFGWLEKNTNLGWNQNQVKKYGNIPVNTGESGVRINKFNRHPQDLDEQYEQ